MNNNNNKYSCDDICFNPVIMIISLLLLVSPFMIYFCHYNNAYYSSSYNCTCIVDDVTYMKMSEIVESNRTEIVYKAKKLTGRIIGDNFTIDPYKFDIDWTYSEVMDSLLIPRECKVPVNTPFNCKTNATWPCIYNKKAESLIWRMSDLGGKCDVMKLIIMILSIIKLTALIGIYCFFYKKKKNTPARDTAETVIQL